MFWWWMAVAAVWLLSIALVQPQEPGQKARIKDVTTIEGIRDNQLVGYGLVVGLEGHGRQLADGLSRADPGFRTRAMGITVPQTGSNSASNMQVKNMAAVFVVATLPPFSRPGYKVDVTVSSAGDARSIEGGILLMTPLYGPMGRSTRRRRERWCWAVTRPRRRQLKADESSHHGAHSGRRHGGAGVAFRLEADATVSVIC
jgi:flagellar basal body P-ring protein FlgI